MLAVLLAAPFLGLDNFVTSVALGLDGPRWATRLWVVTIFGGLAAAAIVLGSAVGTASAAWLGASAQYLGGLILVGLGAYQLWQERQPRAVAAQPPITASGWSLLALGVGVSIDTTVAGVAFGLRGDPILASAVVVGCVTAVMSLGGLGLGAAIGHWSARLSRRVAPTALVLVGLGIATGVL